MRTFGSSSRLFDQELMVRRTIRESKIARNCRYPGQGRGRPLPENQRILAEAKATSRCVTKRILKVRDKAQRENRSRP